MYTEYLKNGGKVDKIFLKSFVINYLNIWMKERGAGHYKFINEIFFKLYRNDFSNISDKNMPSYIETQITMPSITDYIVEVLVHYTKFKKNGDLNLREYLNAVYIKIIDIYGFINTYYPLLELLSNNYSSLDKPKLNLFDKLSTIYKKYLYKPTYKPYNNDELFSDLKELGDLIYIIAEKREKIHSPVASGIKKKSIKKQSSRTLLFKRKPLVKRFKNPIFLSLK